MKVKRQLPQIPEIKESSKQFSAQLVLDSLEIYLKGIISFREV